MELSFWGYRRPDGQVGSRNLVGILPTTVCVNEVCERIAREVQGAVAFLHHQGCCQTAPDIERVTRTLANLARHPNLASVLVVSLGCESVSPEAVAQGATACGKQAPIIRVQELGGSAAAVAEGSRLVQALVQECSHLTREPVPLQELVVGIKCGASDSTSGLAANPTVGAASDLIVAAGGTVVFGETTEFIGAEHILARRACCPEVHERILHIVDRMERRAMAAGADMRGGQPTPGNIAGGLTTIEEKSLGAIVKSGTSPIQAVYEYGDRPDRKGLVIVDSPGREPELLTAMAAAGAHVILFTTGRGAPQGFPFVPTIKICGNPHTWARLSQHLDFDATGVLRGKRGVAQAGRALLGEILEVASGKATKAEIIGYFAAMDIYTTGPTI